MSLPRWLLRLFPRLAPQGRWGDAVRVTDPKRLAQFHVIYAEQVAWCRARGFTITAPDCRVTLRYWPDTLRPPDGFGIAKVLAPNVISGDTGGTVLIQRGYLHADDILAHEVRHAITGIGDHPKDLFPEGW